MYYFAAIYFYEWTLTLRNLFFSEVDFVRFFSSVTIFVYLWLGFWVLVLVIFTGLPMIRILFWY